MKILEHTVGSQRLFQNEIAIYGHGLVLCKEWSQSNLYLFVPSPLEPRNNLRRDKIGFLGMWTTNLPNPLFWGK